MPILFVHGVNTRLSREYLEDEHARNDFLKRLVAPALGVKDERLSIRSPYWGKEGVKFQWDMACLPGGDGQAETFGAGTSDEHGTEAFGGGLDAVAKARIAQSAAVNFESGETFIELARRDFPAAVESATATALAASSSEHDKDGIVQTYADVSAYAATHPQPAWVEEVTEDQFIARLEQEVERWSTAKHTESYGAGFWDSLKEGVSRLRGKPADLASSYLASHVRRSLNEKFTRFCGDAFVYLATRPKADAPDGEISPITKEVLDAIKAADEERKQKGNHEPLIVIAHSFGGEIIYDIATRFAPNITIDCLITVGSQVGLFEEMKLLAASDKKIFKPERVKRPDSIKRWLNVYDVNDPFSYRVEGIFDGAQDYHFDTGFHTLAAHGGYFERPSFYVRLAERLKSKPTST